MHIKKPAWGDGNKPPFPDAPDGPGAIASIAQSLPWPGKGRVYLLRHHFRRLEEGRRRA